MTEAVCKRCGGSLVGGACPACGPAAASGAEMDEAKRKLEETRERLGAWKERLSKRLDEFQKKREVLSAMEARRISRAPTQPLEDLGDAPQAHPAPLSRSPAPAPPTTPSASASSPSPSPEFSEFTDRTVIMEESGVSTMDPTVVVRATEVEQPLRGSLPPADATGSRTLAPRGSPRSGPDGEGPALAADPRSGSFPSPAPPSATGSYGALATDPGGYGVLPTDPGGFGTGDRAASDRAAAPPPEGSLVSAPSAAETFAAMGASFAESSSPAREAMTGPVPSLVRRASSLLLDLILLFLVPAGLILGPVAWWGLEGSPASVWTRNLGVLLPLLGAIFVLLEALYLGAFGRTPGLKLTGLKVVDASGATPGFGLALLRAITFPLVLVPPLESVSRTRTTSDI